MKTRKKEHKNIKIIKAAALVLFLALLFTPEQRNRSVIAGIAIAGITGSLLFLLIPMLPHIPILFKKYLPTDPRASEANAERSCL